MLEQILLKINTYIPTYWPLRSFIAVNPLYGLTQNTFEKCISDLSRYIDINGALPLDYYHKSYTKGEIGLNSLNTSIQEFLQDKNIQSDLNSNVLLDLLINSQTQKMLEQEINSISNNKSILISSLIERNQNYLENNKVHVKISKFMADFFDLGQAKWNMPIKNNNLYKAWLEYCAIENSYIKSSIQEISSKSNFEAINYLVDKLEIKDDFLEQYFVEIIFKILGWCGLIKWLEERPDNLYINKNAQINDVLAIWLSLEYSLSVEYGYKFNHDLKESTHNLQIESIKEKLLNYHDLYTSLSSLNVKLIWQRALEIEYKNNILNKIKLANQKLVLPSNEIKKCKSQIILCIDTRSEGIRRKLEYIDNYQTFGFAGFFGIGFKLQDERTNVCSFQCPAIVKPDVTIINKSISQKNRWINNLKNNLYTSLNKVKNTFFAPLVLFDMVGIYFSISLICKTVFPNKINKLFNRGQNLNYTDASINVFDTANGFTTSEIAEKASFVLKSIGLIDNFAPFVIIGGHVAESENNPFQSSLDCGACGGNGGIPNAIAFCQGLNNNQVREILNDKYAINIPQETFFVSACHNTTIDKFYYYNLNLMNELQYKSFTAIINDIDNACDLLRKERLLSLYGEKDVTKRKSNWSELIPEMALVNNAAFIIAPRKITKDINLDRRTFLHSYEPDLDPEGEILSFIFNAPVIVGHWINSQYYFSTTDKHLYGAGNKAIHNILGGFGVMEGNFSDLKMGLPEQSIFYRDKLVHQPLRLTVFVYAKKQIIEKIINKSPQLINLFNGRWIHLEVLEPV